jgi:hypothetical protein
VQPAQVACTTPPDRARPFGDDGGAMKFGITIMGLSLRHFPDVAQVYDECGFESVWVPEDLVFPAEVPTNYPFDINGEPSFSAATPT